MQITLNIDSTNIGATVEQVFQTLSEETKSELAKQVMLEVLRNPVGAERTSYERKVVEDLLAYNKSKGNYDNTEEKVRSSYEYRQKMERFKSTSERMIEEIVSSTIKHYKKLVDDLVKSDPQIQSQWEQVREKFVADFPNLMQMTMATYFASQMAGISQSFLQASGVRESHNMLATQLQQMFGQQGLHLHLAP